MNKTRGRIDILGVRLDTPRRAALRGLVSSALDSTEKTSFSKINTEFLLRAHSETLFLQTINVSFCNIVDGRGVQWAARYLSLPTPATHYKLLTTISALWQMVYSGAAIVFNPGYITLPIPEVFPGVEAFELMLGVAEEKQVGVFIFGATQEVLDKAIVNIHGKFPRLKISGSLNGFDYQNATVIPALNLSSAQAPAGIQKENADSLDSRFRGNDNGNRDNIGDGDEQGRRKDQGGHADSTPGGIDPVEEINKTDAKLLFVALGSPKQEYWIQENLERLKNVRVAVGEGGTLDRVANPAQKAPKWINSAGLEWLWRLCFNKSKTETRNRFQRFWNSVPVFIYEVVKWKIKHGSTSVDGSE